jgi:diaminohydroxyphosphoribosylaminopyrimidine deaminase / 5-amino-6-(5-phosphoribosylamino)uracil reductase
VNLPKSTLRPFTPEDERHMRRALQLATRGQGRVEPNPMVGCVITRAGHVIGAGYHRRYGGPHAEIEALRHCAESPRGATAYVTLEPCCYFGKTPPCSDALIAAGVQRVVAAVADPNPRVAGAGLAQLRQAGIRVDAGLLADECTALNAPFFKLVQHGRPWVILKWAQSLDGTIATRTRDSRWISDEICRADVQRTRGRVDAILVGVGTVLRDDPQLTCRLAPVKRVATRIVLDTQLRTPPHSRLVRTAREIPTWLLCSKNAPARRATQLTAAGCSIHRVAAARTGVSLAAVLDLLGRARLTNVLVEGGGQVLGQFCDRRLFDELQVYVAPLLIGGHAALGALDGQGPARIADALRLPASTTWRSCGNGWVIRARL